MKRSGYVPARACALCLALLFLAAAAVSAQTATATLKGRITDDNDRPVRDARITVTNATTHESKDVSADSDGNYQLTGLVADRYDVTVEAPRHKRRRIAGIVLSGGQTRTLDARLSLEGGGGPSGGPGNGGEPRYAVCFDYVFLHVHESSFNESLNGFDGCFQVNIHRHVGIEAEGGVAFHSQSGVSEHLFWFNAGPVFPFAPADSKIVPWVHATVGYARDSVSSGGSSSGENSFLFKVGGGVNVKVASRVQWRVVSVDYAPTHFSSSFQQNIEVRSGICFIFGSK